MHILSSLYGTMFIISRGWEVALKFQVCRGEVRAPLTQQTEPKPSPSKAEGSTAVYEAGFFYEIACNSRDKSLVFHAI